MSLREILIPSFSQCHYFNHYAVDLLIPFKMFVLVLFFSFLTVNEIQSKTEILFFRPFLCDEEN